MNTGGTARAAVFGRIRSALGVEKLDRTRQAAVKARLARHPRNLIPMRARKSGEACLTLLAEMLRAQGADVSRVATPEAVVGAVASYLGSQGLPPQIRMGSDPVLAALPWRDAWDIERVFGPAAPDDHSALTRASAAAAETGTLFLVSGPENPTMLNFLPETSMILVAASDVVGSYEEAFDRLRRTYGEGTLPRTVNLISGPSRTADIEQTIIRGAQGPKRLHVLILG